MTLDRPIPDRYAARGIPKTELQLPAPCLHMSWETTVYKRDELYEQVWSEPMRDVARRYGVSDVALARTCRKLAIPLPGRGYWAKKAAGYSLVRPALPLLKAGAQAQYSVSRWKEPLSSIPPSEEAQQQLARERQTESRITVAETLEDPHPLVRLSGPRLWRAARPRHREDPTRERCLDIRVSVDTLDRALRIADALLKALEARGFVVEITEPGHDNVYRHGHPAPGPSETRVQINGEWVAFSIEENRDAIEIPPPPPPKRRASWEAPYSYTPRPEKTYRPNGKLTLRIKSESYGSGRRRIWSDGKNQRVEDCLNDFVGGLIATAEALRVARLEREQRERERLEAELRRHEEEERRRHEAKLVYDLESRVADWNAARTIRDFLGVVEADATKQLGAIEPDSDLGRWLGWARQRAEVLASQAVRTVLQLRTPPAQQFRW